MILDDNSQNYITLHQMLKIEQFEELRPNASDFIELQRAASEILLMLKQKGLFKQEIPEFLYGEDDFTGEFSKQLAECLCIDLNDYENLHVLFNKIFAFKTGFGSVHLASMDFISSFIGQGGGKIILRKEYEGQVSDSLLDNINKSIEWGRLAWVYGLNSLLAESDYDCALYQYSGEYSYLENEQFGVNLFVHYTGKVLECKIINSKEEYADIGLLLINENGVFQAASHDDLEKLHHWILSEYEKSPEKPLIDKSYKRAEENWSPKKMFIEYTYFNFTNSNLPKAEKLKITKRDIVRAWDSVLPPKNECKWKLPGKRIHKKKS